MIVRNEAFNPYADDPKYQKFKDSLPSFEERFRPEPPESGTLPSSPKAYQEAFHATKRAAGAKGGISAAKHKNHKPVKPVPDCIAAADGVHPAWKRASVGNGAYRLGCLKCGVTKRVDREEYMAVQIRKPGTRGPHLPKGPKK